MRIFALLRLFPFATVANSGEPIEVESAQPLAEHAVETDQELAKKARVSREAFGELYERHVTAIYRYVYYRVGNMEDT